jgi:hypothetical protein
MKRAHVSLVNDPTVVYRLPVSSQWREAL